jgi:hypothetical protein
VAISNAWGSKRRDWSIVQNVIEIGYVLTVWRGDKSIFLRNHAGQFAALNRARTLRENAHPAEDHSEEPDKRERLSHG